MTECFVVTLWQIAIFGIIIAIPCFYYCFIHGDDTYGFGKFVSAAVGGCVGAFMFVIGIVHYLPCITVVP